MVNIIFTEEFISKLEEEYKRNPDKWHLLHFYATHEKAEFYRQEINIWASGVPKAVIDKMMPFLRRPDRHIHTRNELRVCYHISQLGLNIEYEKKLDDKTPDILVSNSNLEFLVEVFTANVSESESIQLKLKDDLGNRINNLQYSVALRIRTDRAFTDKARNGFVVENLKLWLDSKPKIGEHYVCEGVYFKIIHYNCEWNNTQFIGFSSAMRVKGNKLFDKIYAKVKEYYNLSIKYSLPLVIAIIPDFHTGLSFEELVNVVLGRYTSKSLKELIEKPVEKEDISEDGLFSNEAISAVLWISTDLFGKSMMQNIINPNARYILPGNVLMKKSIQI